MYTGKTEKVSIDSKLTIEHILPQGWEAHWPLPDGLDVESATKCRNGLLHTIGNLTLATKKLNPAMSNGPWLRKRQALLEHSLLAMNRKLSAFDEWTEIAIENRSKDLFVLAKKIWPRTDGS